MDRIKSAKDQILRVLVNPDTSKLQKLVLLVGAVNLIKLAVKWIPGVLRRLVGLLKALIPGHLGRALRKTYGGQSYVLVTGSTSGIGKAIAKEFARLGFNIISVSRNPKKLEMTKNELLAINPKIDVISIKIDFSRSTELKIFEDLAKRIKDYDISVLVNNVGVDSLHQLQDLQIEAIHKQLSINVFATTMMTKTLIANLRNRPKRSAVINLSSLAAELPMPYMSLYCASKAYIEMLTKSLAKENRGKVHFMSVRPSEVSTPMTSNKELDLMTITPEQCARAILWELAGRWRGTAGHWNHRVQEGLYRLVPGFLFDFVFERFIVKANYAERGILGEFKPL